MPGWQIALIAVAAALVTAIAAVLIERSRTARRRPVRPLTDSIL
jgi:biopolymer transport protein ExbB/TolQ